MLEEMAREIVAGTGWEVESDVSIICPCGDQWEWDSACPDCGPNPLMAMGLI